LRHYKPTLGAPVMSLLTELEIATHIGRSRNGVSADELMNHHQVSRPTLMRMIADLRHMGAEIESRRIGRHVFVCTNWSAIRENVGTWARLEKEQWLSGPRHGTIPGPEKAKAEPRQKGRPSGSTGA
jgi:biotin operon repressor